MIGPSILALDQPVRGIDPKATKGGVGWMYGRMVLESKWASWWIGVSSYIPAGVAGIVVRTWLLM